MMDRLTLAKNLMNNDGRCLLNARYCTTGICPAMKEKGCGVGSPTSLGEWAESIIEGSGDHQSCESIW